MEETGQISQFKMWYNPFPAFLFAKQIKREVEKITALMNDRSEDTDLFEGMKNKHIADKQFSLIAMQAAELIIIQHLDLKSRLMIVKEKIRTRRLRKIKSDSNIFNYAVRKAEELTGIKIETLDDVLRFQKRVRFETDKLDDRLQKEREKRQTGTTDKKIKLIDLAFSIMIYLGYSNPVDIEKMRITHFINIRNKALEKHEAEKQEYEKMKNKYK